jgi:hypothetical protein
MDNFSYSNTNNISNYWADRGNFYEYLAPQDTDEWKKVRKGRITSSNTGIMANKSKFKKPEDMSKIICGIENECFDEEANLRMNFGKVNEPIARKWYEENYHCKIIQRGLCIPKNKNEFWLGASVDGEIGNSDGIIEIKCPKKMYPSLKSYIEHKDHGWKPKNYVDHIYRTHYTQMQQACYVLKKKFCDYIVYCPTESIIFVQRIYFNKQYWDEHCKIISKNYDIYIKPFLNSKYPISPL